MPCCWLTLLVGKQVDFVDFCATSRYPLRTAYLSNQHSSIKRAPIATRRFGWRLCPALPIRIRTPPVGGAVWGRRKMQKQKKRQDRPGQAATTSPHTLPLAWWTTSPSRRLGLAELCAAVGADSSSTATRSLASQSQR